MDNFVKKIEMIHPDIAMLSFERYCEPTEDEATIKASLDKVYNEIRERIGSYIELKKLVACDFKEFNDHSADLGYFGKRTIDIN